MNSPMTTEMNPEIAIAFQRGGREGVTELNPAVGEMTSTFRPQVGSVLSEKYRITAQLTANTGEADLYLCENGGVQYCAKLYRREIAIKPRVLAALQSVDSPYVAKLYDTGFYNGFPYEILPYYENGSLAGKRYTYEEIKTKLLPCINEALRALHEKGILHKDLKPSNIMLLPREEGIALIDFGISSVMGEGHTVLLTQTGMTPEYSAPETFRGVYLEESDYYSLGITLYELFCGHTPYRHMSPEAITQYMAVRRIPFPEDMPQELKDLIFALTYQDLTSRNERENPNKRWTYEEVASFLRGDKQPLPGYGAGGPLSDEIEPYRFGSKEYTTLSALVKALGEDWQNGKKELFRGILSAHFDQSRPVLARYCRQAEEDSVKESRKDDIVFWKLLYRLYPELQGLYWKGRVFHSPAALGRDMLEKLGNKKNRESTLWDSILEEGLLSAYLDRSISPKTALREAVRALETEHRMAEGGERGKLLRYYLIAYLLSGQRLLYLEGKEFKSVSELHEHLKSLYEESYDKLKAFCHKIMATDGSMNVQLEAWLIAIGERAALERWRNAVD